MRSEVRDGMRIDWDVGITMDDGIVLRADVFRPPDDGKYPVILTYGPYAKGLTFQKGYPDQWRIIANEHPDVVEGSTNKYQSWEVWAPKNGFRTAMSACELTREVLAAHRDTLTPFHRETQDLYLCIEWAGV